MWDAVRWTRATQITEHFDLSEDAAALAAPDDVPEHYFELLRDAGALDDAIRFMAFALPRRICIAWGHACIARTARDAKLKPADVAAYSAVGAWLKDPSEEQRWIAHRAAQSADFKTAEAVLAFAVFVSGGSLSPPESPQQVPAPPDMSPRLVSGAVLLAAVRVAPVAIRDAKLDFLARGLPYAKGEIG